MTRHTDVVVIGGGQAGLAAGYHLRRRHLEFVILDADPAPGGSWQLMWESLHLFSPAEHSSLPGRPTPAQAGEVYPDAGHVVDHLADYEKCYDLPVQHGVRVDAVRRGADRLLVEADSGTWWAGRGGLGDLAGAEAVINATGTWSRPFLPAVPGREAFAGQQLDTVNHRSPADFAGQQVSVVGGGNSGAQLATDLALAGNVHWDPWNEDDAGEVRVRPSTLDLLWEDEQVQEEGTHSTLDMHRVLRPDEEPDYGTVQPVQPAEARRTAGVARLTRAHVQAVEALASRRWFGRCAVLHDAHDRPSEIYFWGFSGD